MAQITRPTKGSSGTASYVDDTPANASEVNADFDEIVDEINGKLDDNNILASASTPRINASKIDDHSDNDATQDDETDPGAFASMSNPTTLEGELERLRFTINRIVSRNNTTSNYWGDDSTTQASMADIRHPNMIRNGGFETYTGAANSAPDGWSTISGSVPVTIAQDTADADGPGASIDITGDSDNDGIEQTIVGAALRATTSYIVRCRAKCVSGVTATLATAGGGTDVSETTTSTSWVTLEGVLITDGTPADVDVQLRTSGGTWQANFDRVEMYPIFTAEKVEQGAAVAFQSSTTLGTPIGHGTTQDPWTMDAVSDTMSRSVVVPGAGYYIEVKARCSGEYEPINSTLQTLDCELQEDVDGGGYSTVDQNIGMNFAASTTQRFGSVNLFYMNLSPTPGATYTYKAIATYTAQAADEFDPQGESGDHYSFLSVECKRFG